MRLLRADAVGMATAHGLFLDGLNAGRLLIIGRPELSEAAKPAEERRLAGSFAVDGYQGVEPLIACELAVWVLAEAPPRNAGRGRVIALS